MDIGAFADEGIRLTGDWTTSRTINFSFASQVDTNGFNWTINSPVTGNAATINKVGAGMWTLTQGGTLGQSLASGSGGSTHDNQHQCRRTASDEFDRLGDRHRDREYRQRHPRGDSERDRAHRGEHHDRGSSPRFRPVPAQTPARSTSATT